MQRMRILLQQRDTSLYFGDINSWCADTSEAMDFVSYTKALEFCALNRLDAVQVVLKFEDEKYEIVLPDAAAQSCGGDRPSATA